MTGMSSTVPSERDSYTGPRCQSCGGPCARWKGSVWQYTCTGCIERYLDDSERAWQARSANVRDKITRNLLHGNDYPNFRVVDGSAAGRGGSALCTAPRPDVDQLAI